MTIRLGYQIPNFTYPDTAPSELFGKVVAQAQAAERSGFDTVLVMDHFYQLPGIGTPDREMLEAYTALAALATATESVQLSALVTGNTYRNPAMLAKTVTTLDVVSGGRALLGIGAGWFEKEHHDYGYEFGTFSDRFERLEEALQIIMPMLRGEHATFEGEWYRASEAMNNPRVRDDMPVFLGGGGEKKTFRLAAIHADHLDIICNRADLPRKLEALAARCEENGRDRSTITTSHLCSIFVAETDDAAWDLLSSFLGERGVDFDTLDDDRRARITARMIVGGPDEVARQVTEEILDVGVDGITMNMMANGHDPDMVELAGKTLRPLFT